MWSHLLTLGLIDGAGGGSTEPGRNAGSVISAGRPRRFVTHKPLLQRVLEARAKKLNPPKVVRAKVRAIEVEAAQEVLAGGGEEEFRALLARWKAQVQPKLETAPQEIDPEQLFMAQVAMRIRALEYERQLEQEEEDEILALLLD